MNVNEIEQKLYDTFTDVLSQDNYEPDDEGDVLRSVVGVIHTLIADGRTAELSRALREGFPEYYMDAETEVYKLHMRKEQALLEASL